MYMLLVFLIVLLIIFGALFLYTKNSALEIREGLMGISFIILIVITSLEIQTILTSQNTATLINKTYNTSYNADDFYFNKNFILEVINKNKTLKVEGEIIEK